MKEDILIAGFGGQGVVLAGSLLANTAMEEGLETCGIVSYGVEMRGGAANSTVTIADHKIGSPVVVNPDSAIIMNQESLFKFEKDIKRNGLMIVNSSECKNVSRTDIEIIEIPATKIAEELGDKRAANLVMIGAYLQKKKILTIEAALSRIKKVLPKATDKVIELNRQ